MDVMPQNLMMIGNPWQLLLVVLVVFLLFGKGKISDLMGDMAKGIKAFKKGMSDEDNPAAPAGTPPKPLEHEPVARTGAGTHTEAGTKP
jgi:sec-independent protein translocase protein TatA